VEVLAKEIFGQNHMQNMKRQNELSQINKELRKLKKQIKQLEGRYPFERISENDPGDLAFRY